MDFGLPNFFGFAYSEDQLLVLRLLKESKKRGASKVILMSAPSFVVDFDYKDFCPLMKGLGFDKVTELTFGAKIVNSCYRSYIKENKEKQEKFIASVCPSTVELVKNKYPYLKRFLLPFDSPMVAMSKVLKKNYPKHKIVFVSPCSAKKVEAKKSFYNGKQLIDAVITFSELKQILAKEKPKKLSVSHKFDSFYNDYTKIYPLSGGLGATLNKKGILSESEMVSCDGFNQIQRVFEKKLDKVFFDVLFCNGGCIGGNGISSKLPIVLRKQKVLSYRNFSKKENMDGNQGLSKYFRGINFSKKFD
ncbi:MAG: [Fe-Fe] hydrogenase large subunit C-terminal domain-containing protein [archaeon]|jgi:iron only hydrogenase large subunit-like protein